MICHPQHQSASLYTTLAAYSDRCQDFSNMHACIDSSLKLLRLSSKLPACEKQLWWPLLLPEQLECLLGDMQWLETAWNLPSTKLEDSRLVNEDWLPSNMKITHHLQQCPCYLHQVAIGTEIPTWQVLCHYVENWM